MSLSDNDFILGRVFWFCLGGISLALGAIGAILPILPTTPFVILSAFAFGKSSPRLAAWLNNSPTFGPMIADWRSHGAIAPRYKRIAVTMMAARNILILDFLRCPARKGRFPPWKGRVTDAAGNVSVFTFS